MSARNRGQSTSLTAGGGEAERRRDDMRGTNDHLGRVLVRQMACHVQLAKKYRAEGHDDRVYDLFKQNLRRALLYGINRSQKAGERS